jgi:hypothetical protein
MLQYHWRFDREVLRFLTIDCKFFLAVVVSGAMDRSSRPLEPDPLKGGLPAVVGYQAGQQVP